MEFIATKVQIFYNCSLLDDYKNGKKAIKLYALKIKLIFALSGNDLAEKKSLLCLAYIKKKMYICRKNLCPNDEETKNRNI